MPPLELFAENVHGAENGAVFVRSCGDLDGVSEGDREAGDDEKWPHRVKLDGSIGSANAETGAQCGGSTGAQSTDGDSLPVQDISWDKTKRPTSWLGELPTEAEWGMRRLPEPEGRKYPIRARTAPQRAYHVQPPFTLRTRGHRRQPDGTVRDAESGRDVCR